MKKSKNEYLMWANGPLIELPDEYYWDIAAQEVVMNDLSWRGDLAAFWSRQHDEANAELRDRSGGGTPPQDQPS